MFNPLYLIRVIFCLFLMEIILSETSAKNYNDENVMLMDITQISETLETNEDPPVKRVIISLFPEKYIDLFFMKQLYNEIIVYCSKITINNYDF